jgi:hypothetical protein
MDFLGCVECSTIWNLIDSFLAFNISYIPREINQLVDSLVVSSSTFNPPLPPKLNYVIQVKYRPSLPDNVNFWKVFEDNEKLVRFMEVIDEFFSLHIDQENENDEKIKNHRLKNKIGRHDIIQLPNNQIPRGLVTLEKLFDQNDVPLKPDKKEEYPIFFKYDLGDEQCPKTINLSTHLTTEQRSNYGSLMKEFSDIFAWDYSDLKTYETQVIEHKISLKKEATPFKKKQRSISPLLLPIMEKEIKKLLNAQIIIPLRYSEWVSNLVPVRKKNGEIRLCVDFRNLNKCSKKDSYPLSKMEHILQRVSRASVMSFIDGFSGYNQISVHIDDRENIAFKTP